MQILIEVNSYYLLRNIMSIIYIN